MDEQYYVQFLACQSLKQIVPVPYGLQIPKKYLCGIENDEFISAFQTYQEILKQMYIDVIQNPETFGMVCLPIEENKSTHSYGSLGPVTKNESKSRKSFFQLPNTLLSLANTGVLTSGGGLAVNVTSFKEFKNTITSTKVVKPELILNRMIDYGFEFEGMLDDFKFKSIQSFTMFYPDNRNVIIVLKAFGHVGFYEKMISADFRYLFCDEGQNIEFDINDILRISGNDTDKKVVKAVYNTMKDKGFTSKIEYYGFWGKMRFPDGKSKKEILVVDIERNHTIKINIRLTNISAYSKTLNNISPNVKKQLLSGRDCSHCGYCKDGCTKFTYEGQTYDKCSIICCGFSFNNFTDEDISSLIQLLDLELSYVII